MIPQPPGISYRLLSLLLLPVWLFHAITHARKFAVADYLRLRSCANSIKPQGQIWVHAASVGEVESVSPLVSGLLDQGQTILFTSFTATGFLTIKRNFSDQVQASIIPIDFIWHCRRFFRQHSIKCCLLMETELWPELLYQAARNNIPIIQLNARLSKKSLEAPLFVRSLLRRTLAYISLHLTRDENDKTNLISLGAAPRRIKVIGNLKSRATVQVGAAKLVDRPYVLLASSHADEELQLLQHRPQKHRRQLIVIAPRHPKRSQDIQRHLNSLNVKYAVRSLSQPVTDNTEVYLADTLGELKSFMAHAQIVIMGGSFDQTGGHNLLEPANLGCAIITGPSDSNIRADIELLQGNQAIFQVDDFTACWQQVDELLNNPAQAKKMGESARQAILNQPDIVTTYLTAIAPYLADDIL